MPDLKNLVNDNLVNNLYSNCSRSNCMKKLFEQRSKELEKEIEEKYGLTPEELDKEIEKFSNRK